MAQKRFYEIWDVFSTKPFCGNPLAVVHDAQGLTDAQMLALTREFQLSETVFIEPAPNPMHKARLRIFKAAGEMPFAGHPTIGAAIAIAQKAQMPDNALLVLEEKIGPIRCLVHREGEQSFAEFDLAKNPHPLDLTIEKETFAAAFGLDSRDVGFENHMPTFWSAGVPFYYVPLHNLTVMAAAKPDPIYIGENFAGRDGWVPSFYLYCRETQCFQSAFHARMFRPDGSEDAATGSAASAFCGVVQHFDKPLDGLKQIWIEQGVEMGRPSQIRLEWDVVQGKINGARVGGHAVKIAEGHVVV